MMQQRVQLLGLLSNSKTPQDRDQGIVDLSVFVILPKILDQKVLLKILPKVLPKALTFLLELPLLKEQGIQQ